MSAAGAAGALRHTCSSGAGAQSCRRCSSPSPDEAPLPPASRVAASGSACAQQTLPPFCTVPAATQGSTAWLCEVGRQLRNAARCWACHPASSGQHVQGGTCRGARAYGRHAVVRRRQQCAGRGDAGAGLHGRLCSMAPDQALQGVRHRAHPGEALPKRQSQPGVHLRRRTTLLHPRNLPGQPLAGASATAGRVQALHCTALPERLGPQQGRGPRTGCTCQAVAAWSAQAPGGRAGRASCGVAQAWMGSAHTRSRSASACTPTAPSSCLPVRCTHRSSMVNAPVLEAVAVCTA